MSSTAPGAAHTTARNRPTSAGGANTRGAWIGSGGSGSGSVVKAASSWQNGDGSIDSSPLSLSTAVTSRRLRARAIAAINSLRSSASSGALLDKPRSASVATPSITSTRC